MSGSLDSLFTASLSSSVSLKAAKSSWLLPTWCASMMVLNTGKPFLMFNDRS